MRRFIVVLNFFQIEGGQLVHSKKNGEGYVDNDAKLNKIVAGIEEALAAG